MKKQFTIIAAFLLLSIHALNAQSYTWKKVSGGAFYAVALRSDGTLWSWGSNIFKTLGTDKTGNKLLPVQIGSDTDWVNVDAAATMGLALKKNGTLWQWGNFGWVNTNVDSLPLQVGNDTDWKDISAGGVAAYALKKNGTVWAWGNNEYLGAEFHQRSNGKPAMLDTIKSCIKISAGNYYLMAITKDGTLWRIGGGIEYAWDSTERFLKIPGNGIWVDVAAGGGFILGIQKDASLWALGGNNFGQLGIGDTTIHTTRYPLQIGTQKNWKNISAGSSHSFAITNDGQLFGWGKNKYGQLGDGTNINRYAPVRIGADKEWINIEAVNGSILMNPGKDDDINFSGDFSFGIKAPGNQICATGLNDSGQLGINSTISTNTFNCNLGLVTGLNEQENKKTGIKNFPNPTSGIINIQLNDNALSIKNENKLIRIKNISGQVIISNEIKPGETNVKIDLQRFPKGVYFLDYTSNSRNYTEKLILY